jgi:hypothetical protein
VGGDVPRSRGRRRGRNQPDEIERRLLEASFQLGITAERYIREQHAVRAGGHRVVEEAVDAVVEDRIQLAEEDDGCAPDLPKLAKTFESPGEVYPAGDRLKG